jgi:hypothetical protein
MTKVLPFLGTILCALAATPAWACSVCFGDPNSAQARGATMAVGFMLALTGAVLGTIGTVIFRFWQRGRRLGQTSEHSILP